ncbi:odorant receptor 94b-like [Nymphalis io]|uniref:odorant receptor 94b-like n=1 Tax=Inachis io TaxID=171585 RepID=UPI002168A92C|nr:odorant receptor 94b-like [Nymphalis io]
MRWRSGSAFAVRVHAGYRTVVLAITSIYLLQECVYAYQERNDMTKLSRVMFLLLCHITSIAKQIVFHTDADRIHEMIQSLNDPIYNESSGYAQSLLHRTARGARFLLSAYTGCAVLTCMLWLLFLVMHRIAGRSVEFPFWTGLHTDRPFVFVLVLLYSFYVTTLVGIANTTMDALVATILYQCQTQLRILRNDFQSLPEKAKKLSNRTGESYEAVLMSLLVKCFNHYKRVTETARLLQDISGVTILVQFGIGGWILCMAAYKLVSLNILSIEFASMALFILCILTELFLYCYYGNELTVESDRIVCSVYSMQWVHTPHRFRRALVLLMQFMRRPLRPAAGRVIPLSLDTFVKILKSSYTFYAVLRQTNK